MSGIPARPVLVIGTESVTWDSLPHGSSLRFLQEKVEGWVEVVNLGLHDNGMGSRSSLDLWVNEEGTYTKRDHPNPFATLLVEFFTGHAPFTEDGILYGNCVVTFSDRQGETVPLSGSIIGLLDGFASLVNS